MPPVLDMINCLRGQSHGVESAARSCTIFDVYKNCFIYQAMLMVLTVVEIRRLFSEL